jgi:hypothetical protein
VLISAREAKAGLAEILEARPDLKGKSIEAKAGIAPRGASSLRPRRTPKGTKVNPQSTGQ